MANKEFVEEGGCLSLGRVLRRFQCHSCIATRNDPDATKFRSLLQHVPCRVLGYERRAGMSQNPAEGGGNRGVLKNNGGIITSPPPPCNA
jgi:hypothetical protein